MVLKMCLDNRIFYKNSSIEKGYTYEDNKKNCCTIMKIAIMRYKRIIAY